MGNTRRTRRKRANAARRERRRQRNARRRSRRRHARRRRRRRRDSPLTRYQKDLLRVLRRSGGGKDDEYVMVSRPQPLHLAHGPTVGPPAPTAGTVTLPPRTTELPRFDKGYTHDAKTGTLIPLSDKRSTYRSKKRSTARRALSRIKRKARSLTRKARRAFRRTSARPSKAPPPGTKDAEGGIWLGN